jgi:hypothetical protein
LGQSIFISPHGHAVTLRAARLTDDPTGLAFREMVLAPSALNSLPAACGAYKFPSAISFKTCFSKDRSATSRFRRPFSFSKSFIRRACSRGKYIMLFIYDAIDADIGKELRKKNPNPRFLRNHHQWLKKFGREKVHDHLERVIAIMKLCDNMEDFRAKFARVFKKSPLQLSFDLTLDPATDGRKK